MRAQTAAYTACWPASSASSTECAAPASSSSAAAAAAGVTANLILVTQRMDPIAPAVLTAAYSDPRNAWSSPGTAVGSASPRRTSGISPSASQLCMESAPWASGVAAGLSDWMTGPKESDAFQNRGY